MAAVAFLAALVVSAAPPPAPADVQALASAYVGAVNDGAKVAAYLARDVQDVPPPAIAGFFDDQRWISGGGVDLVGARLRQGSPDKLDLAVRNRIYGGVQGVELTLEHRPDGWRINNLDLTPAPAWSTPAKGSLPSGELPMQVNSLVDRGCAAGVFSGAVLVARGPQILTQKACGEADRRHHIANTPETRFNLGSMDKMFTAVAVLQLAEAGKLSLDDTLDRHLDATWLAPETAKQITVWQLMTHTSGLAPDVMSRLGKQPRDRYRALEDFKPLVRDAKPAFAPGSQFDYSNTGFLLLGAVIAQASGEDYDAYVRRHIFEPAGMAATGAVSADDPVENLATGYRRAPDSAYGWRENTPISLLRGIPAGGGFATTGDLHRFAIALQSGKLVSKASLDRLWADPDQHNYGAGFEVNAGAIGHTVGHSGFFPGVSTRLRLYLDRGYTVIVLANTDRAAPPLVDAIEGAILETRP